MTLTGEQPYAEAAAAMIAERSGAVFALREGVLDVTDIERVHRMRVATRRLRAALEVFAPALDQRRGKRALTQVKELAAALGERRDRDVQLERLMQLGSETDGAERHAIELLAEELREEQQDANVVLAGALREAKRGHLRRRLARLSR
jgi:CHAD domain-containing protein